MLDNRLWESEVLMQLSHSLSKLGAVMKLNWRPREQNQEADVLTKDNYSCFSMSNRIEVRWEDIDHSILDTMLEESESFHAELDSSREDKRNAALTSTLFARRVKKGRKTLKTLWEGS